MTGRMNPFGDLNDFKDDGVGKSKMDRRLATAVADQVAAANDFPSRQAPKAAEKLPQRRHTTGRNKQINIKATQETVERFDMLARTMGVTQGELLAQALAALEKVRDT